MKMARTADGCRTMGDSRGFTLVEVLSVILIIGFLMGLATVSFSTLRQRYNEEQQVRQLLADVLDARIWSMHHGRSTFVSLASNTFYRIYQDTSPQPDGDGLLSELTDSLMTTKNLIAAHTWVKSIPTLTIVQFDDKGLLSSGSPTLVIRIDPSASAEYDCVVINFLKTGMGRMNGPNCTIK
jgi:prepilin-type N-terminal cleavage/methylation domain-containing protein